MSIYLKSDEVFWKKKEFISFILSILVLIIHTTSFSQYSKSGELISVINEKTNYFFKTSITQFAVPMYFIISGIAFYKGYENKKYFQKLKSRLFSLVIPYLLWNTVWTVFDLLCSYTFISNYYIGRTPLTFNLINILKGVLFYQSNRPFWFVFDLIVFAVATPLIYTLIRNKYVGIISILSLSVLSLFNIGLPTSIFFSQTSIIFYMIGALIGKHFFDLASQKSHKGIQWGSLAFLAVYIIIKNVFPAEMHIKNNFIDVIVLTLCCFAFWSITDMYIDKIHPRAVFSRSFAVYSMHVNVSAVITKLFALCFPRTEWLAIPNFFVTVCLTLLVINLVCMFMERFLPKVYAVFMGNRVHKSRPNSEKRQPEIIA